MLFGITVTVIFYCLNISGAISDTKLILNISPASVQIHSKDIFDNIFSVNHAQTYACSFSIKRKL